MEIILFVSILVVSVNSATIDPHKPHTTIDPHSPGPHCWDVSTYGNVYYHHVKREKCMTEFPKIPVPRKKRVCVDAHSVKCSIVPYLNCTMTEVETKYNVTMMVDHPFVPKTCVNVPVVHWHKKKVPVCRPVTKKQCVTNWEVDHDGKKVWSGNEDCKNVTWEKCDLIPRDFQYNTNGTNCTDGPPIEWWDCEKMPKKTKTYNMTCIPLAALKCEAVKEEICKDIEWEDSYQKADEMCIDKMVHIPHQDRKHKKQCILPSENSNLSPTILQDVEEFDSVPNDKLEYEYEGSPIIGPEVVLYPSDLKPKVPVTATPRPWPGRKRRNARKSFDEKRMKKEPSDAAKK